MLLSVYVSEEKVAFYSIALKNGAIGGKLLGAGETGFLLIMAHDHQSIEKNMDCRLLKVNFDLVGSKIIYKDWLTLFVSLI